MVDLISFCGYILLSLQPSTRSAELALYEVFHLTMKKILL